MAEVIYTAFSCDLNFCNTVLLLHAGQYKKVMGFKQKQPKLKVTIAIGGWNEGSGKYSDMASTPENRKAFIDSVLVFIK